MTIKTNVKAGGLHLNHNAKPLVIKSDVKAGGTRINHSAKALVIRSGVKAGGVQVNHNPKAIGTMKIKTKIRAGRAIVPCV